MFDKKKISTLLLDSIFCFKQQLVSCIVVIYTAAAAVFARPTTTRNRGALDPGATCIRQRQLRLWRLATQLSLAVGPGWRALAGQRWQAGLRAHGWGTWGRAVGPFRQSVFFPFYCKFECLTPFLIHSYFKNSAEEFYGMKFSLFS